MSVPQTMAAIEISAPGGPEVLRLATRPTPQPGAGQVLVKVAAAGLNGADLSQRLGRYPVPPGSSDLLGLEVAGEIVALGPDVTELSVGEKICVLTAGGGYAEYCVAEAALALPYPTGFSDLEAGALPETYMTVWKNLIDDAKLQNGETLLVHGGTSGIGVAAIQLAKARGVRVFATAGSADKCAFAESLGAERCINYRTEDFVAVMKEAGGADVILDMVAGDYIARNHRCLKRGGRHHIIALLGGREATFDVGYFMVNQLQMKGSTLRPQPLEVKTAIVRHLREEVWPLFNDGTLKPVIDRSFPLSEAAEAHRQMQAGGHIGKIMLTP